ncbi:MAG: hypothetical protein QXK06_05060 [Candidatus Diapherotrites archaeon]
MKKSLIMSSLLITLLLFLGCIGPQSNPSQPPTPPPATATPSAQTPETQNCTTAECFKQNAEKCTKANFTITETVQETTTKAEANITGKEGEKCQITITLKEITLAKAEPQNETEQKIKTALEEYLNTLKGTRTTCSFTPAEASQTNFENTAFIFRNQCTGSLKEKLQEIETKIKEIISKAGEQQ